MFPGKIVIFEDEFLLANDLKRQLEQFNYRVIAIFRKAEEGLKYFADIIEPEDFPDIVLMDISLAGKMNGIEAAEIMSEKYNFALVFLTGMSQLCIFDEAFKTKPYAFLIKPFDIQQALVSIRLAFYQKNLENRLLKDQVELEDKVAERTRELKLCRDKAEEEIKRKSALLDSLGNEILEPILGIQSNNSKLKAYFESKSQIQQGTLQIDNHIRQVLSVVNRIFPGEISNDA